MTRRSTSRKSAVPSKSINPPRPLFSLSNSSWVYLPLKHRRISWPVGSLPDRWGPEWALAVQPVVHIDVLALVVRSDGDPAPHVTHDEVQVTVEGLVFLGIAPRGADLVQSMADDLALDVLHARDLDSRGGFIHHHRIDDERRLARVGHQLARDQGAQVRGVIGAVPESRSSRIRSFTA